MGTSAAARPFPSSQDEILARFPRLIAHMICESLGYFTPGAAASALADYREGRPNHCEWYTHMASLALAHRPGRDFREALLEIGRDVVRSAIRNRRFHRGFMADYAQARAVVARALQGRHPVFASWF
jgi:hypothetical protein